MTEISLTRSVPPYRESKKDPHPTVTRRAGTKIRRLRPRPSQKQRKGTHAVRSITANHLSFVGISPHVTDPARVGSPKTLCISTLNLERRPNAHVLHCPVEHRNSLPGEVSPHEVVPSYEFGCGGGGEGVPSKKKNCVLGISHVEHNELGEERAAQICPTKLGCPNAAATEQTHQTDGRC